MRGGRAGWVQTSQNSRSGWVVPSLLTLRRYLAAASLRSLWASVFRYFAELSLRILCVSATKYFAELPPRVLCKVVKMSDTAATPKKKAFVAELREIEDWCFECVKRMGAKNNMSLRCETPNGTSRGGCEVFAWSLLMVI